MADSVDFCPYVGLQPFRVKDREYFFGREKEQRVISANLFAAQLTVLYGPSAVGKSSVLQAGVVPHLQAERRTAVVYFSTWQSDSFREELRAECRRCIELAHGGPITVDDKLPLDAWLGAAAAELRGALLLMLDQFEEYLLYHRAEDDQSFDAELARTVNRPDVGVNVLIGLRDDSLSKLNRFSKRIPNLLGNTLQLRRLTPEAARRAIVGPIEKYNARQPAPRPTRIDDALVNAIIADVQIGKVAPSVSGGLAGVRASEDAGLIETAFLQLVLTELWREASAQPGDRVLSAVTLSELGGADAIVRRHVDREMAKLSDDGRAVAAKLFQHLVTPSGAKYALLTTDLVDLAERPADQVLPVLKALAEARLLRRIESSDRYEIFHDAFAEALLDWRKDYLLERAQREAALAAEQKKAEELLAERRRRRRQLLIAAVLLVVVGIGVYLFEERRDKLSLANKNEELSYSLKIAQENERKAAQTSEAAKAAQAQAEATGRQAKAEVEAERLALDAERATLKGDTNRAKQLQAQSQVKLETAGKAKLEVEQYATQSKASLEAANVTQNRIDQIATEAKGKGYDVAPSVMASNNYASTVAPPPATGAAAPAAPVESTASAPPPPVPTGTYKDTYRKAMDAKNQKRWKDVATYLEMAVRQNDTDTGERINISGFGNIEPYVPHYYLGMALKNLNNDCAGALKQFDLSEKDGAIQKTNLYKSLQQERAACSK